MCDLVIKKENKFIDWEKARICNCIGMAKNATNKNRIYTNKKEEANACNYEQWIKTDV